MAWLVTRTTTNCPSFFSRVFKYYFHRRVPFCCFLITMLWCCVGWPPWRMDVSLVVLVPKLCWDFSLISQPRCLGCITLFSGSLGWVPLYFLLCPFLLLYLSSQAVTTRLLFLSRYFCFCHKARRQPWVFNTLSLTLRSNMFSHSFPVNTFVPNTNFSASHSWGQQNKAPFKNSLLSGALSYFWWLLPRQIKLH